MCGKGLPELQNLTNLSLSSFAESHHMQLQNVDVSPNDQAHNTKTPTGRNIQNKCLQHLHALKDSTKDLFFYKKKIKKKSY